MSDEANQTVLRIRLTPEEKQGLEALAISRRTTLSALVRETLYEKYPQLRRMVLEEEPATYDAKPTTLAPLIAAIQDQTQAINRLLLERGATTAPAQPSTAPRTPKGSDQIHAERKARLAQAEQEAGLEPRKE